MKRNRKPNPYPNERPADLVFWLGVGACGGHSAKVHADTKVSIGRTDSKRALGFLVKRAGTGQVIADFVLDKDQVTELTAYLQIMSRALLGRKPPKGSMRAMLEAVENLYKGPRRNKPRR